jgi:hypothetical protein
MTGGKIAERETVLAYGKEFLDWAKTQKFRSPTTRRDVKFQSLPEDEQKRLHRQWSRKQEHGGEDKHREKMKSEMHSWWDKHPNERGFDERLVDEGLIERNPRAREPGVYSPTDEGWEIIREKNKRKQAMAVRVASRWLRSR